MHDERGYIVLILPFIASHSTISCWMWCRDGGEMHRSGTMPGFQKSCHYSLVKSIWA